jgi:hypothetical protein
MGLRIKDAVENRKIHSREFGRGEAKRGDGPAAVE